MIKTTAPAEAVKLGLTNIRLVVIDRHQDVRSDAIYIDEWGPIVPIQKGTDGDGDSFRTGTVSLPEGISAPGALLLTKMSPAPNKDALDYVSSVQLIR